jgi:hypothetical protein
MTPASAQKLCCEGRFMSKLQSTVLHPHELCCPVCSHIIRVEPDGCDTHAFQCPNCNAVLAVNDANTAFPVVTYCHYEPTRYH